MRVLLVSDHYPPFIGGAHRQTRLLAEQLTERGHEMTVVTAWQPGIPAKEEENGVTVHRFRQLRTLVPFTTNDRKQQHQPPFPDPVTVWRLRRLIDQVQPDVVHSYGWFTYSCALALWGKDIPLLISVRDYGYSCAKRTLIYKEEALCPGPEWRRCMGCAAHYYGAPKGWLAVLGVGLGKWLLKRKVEGVHSISSYVQAMVHRDFLPERARNSGNAAPAPEEAIIPSFMMADEITYDEEAVAPYLERLPREPFILFVGALRRMKGVEVLFKAYRRLEAAPPLVLIGTVEFDSPEQFPPGVVVLERFPHQAVMATWERALFGVLPSLGPEPLGSVVYEGMIKGKAVIGAMPSGHEDMIVHEQTGLLVPSGDVDALAEAMQRLIDDAGLRERLAEAARQRAFSFTAAANIPRFEALYRRMARRRGGNAPVEAAVVHDEGVR